MRQWDEENNEIGNRTPPALSFSRAALACCYRLGLGPPGAPIHSYSPTCLVCT